MQVYKLRLSWAFSLLPAYQHCSGTPTKHSPGHPSPFSQVSPGKSLHNIASQSAKKKIILPNLPGQSSILELSQRNLRNGNVGPNLKNRTAVPKQERLKD